MPTKNAPAAFSFVPQPSGQDGGKTTRKFINSHLSRVAAQKRTYGAARRVQRKVKLPAKQSDEPKVAIERLKASAQEHRTTSEDERFIGTPTGNDEDKAIVLRVEASFVPSARPALNFIDTALGTGGTDPFHSTLVPIDTTVRKLLGFEQEAFFPWSAGIEKGADKGGAFRNKFAQIIPEAFDDLCTGYANLARLAALTATVTNDPHMTAIAIKYKALAYQHMRESIAAHAQDEQANELAMIQMFSLMSMEVADGKSESSTIHSKALLRMMTNARDSHNASYVKPSKLLNAVLWHECVRGGNTLRQYVFDPSSLINHAPVLDTLATASKKLLSLGYWPPQPPHEDDGFNQSILPARLVSLALGIRFLTDMNAALTYAPDLIDEDLMGAYGHRASHLCSKLLGVAHVAERFIQHSNSIKHRRVQHHYQRSLQQAYTTRATALAAQFALRAVTSHEAVDLSNSSSSSVAAQLFAVYGTHERVLVELRVAWEGCYAMHGQDEHAKGGWEEDDRGLWLWILWIGTLAERAEGWLRARGLQGSNGRNGGVQDARDEVDAWFNRAFVLHALKMRLRKWEDVKGVLGRYIYFERNTWRSREMFEEGVRRKGVVGVDARVKQEET